MRSIPLRQRNRRPADDFAPSATSAPPRMPSWPGRPDDVYTPLSLPPENPYLLRAFPYPVAADDVDGLRPPCRILDASRTASDHQRRTAALADALAYEAAVAENVLILHPDDATAAAYLRVMRAALPVVADRALPLELAR